MVTYNGFMAGHRNTVARGGTRNAKFEMVTYNGVMAGHMNTVARRELEPFAS